LAQSAKERVAYPSRAVMSDEWILRATLPIRVSFVSLMTAHLVDIALTQFGMCVVQRHGAVTRPYNAAW